MPILNIEFEVICSCGNILSSQSVVDKDYRDNYFVTVEPCETCIEEAKDQGYEEGAADMRG